MLSYQITQNFSCGKRNILNWDKILLSSASSLFFSPQKLVLGQMLLLFIFHLGGIFEYRKQFCKLPAVSVLLGLHRGPNNLWKNSTCVFTRNGFRNIDEFQIKGIYLIQVKWKKVLSRFPEIDCRTCSQTIFLSHKNIELDVNMSHQALPFEGKEDGRFKWFYQKKKF